MFSCTSMSLSLHQFFLQEKSQIYMCEIIQGYKEYEAPVFGNQWSITVPGAAPSSISVGRSRHSLLQKKF